MYVQCFRKKKYIFFRIYPVLLATSIDIWERYVYTASTLALMYVLRGAYQDLANMGNVKMVVLIVAYVVKSPCCK